jgi:DNA (cytosine-5)-methyltransferase 1
MGIDSARLIKEDQHTYEARSKGKAIRSQTRYTLIDLFCGAGGMTLGFSEKFGSPPFSRSGLTTSINSVPKHTIENFGPHCISGDIVDYPQRRQSRNTFCGCGYRGGLRAKDFSLLIKAKRW